MKNIARQSKQLRAARRKNRLGQSAVGAAVLALVGQVMAAGTKSETPAQWYEGGTTSYNNWIELSAGSLMTQGNKTQASQGQQLNTGAFGGIEDLHYETDVAKKTTFTLDGRALGGQNDYNADLSLVKLDLGYIRFHFENFRTWDSGNGGYIPADQQAFSLPGNALAVDRGLISFEAGLTKPDQPQLTFKYSHRYRIGEENSTLWGPEGGGGTPVNRVYPGIYNINEKSDTFQFDLTHHLMVAKKTVNYGAGLAYEIGTFNDSHDLSFWQGQPVQQKATDSQNTTYDMLSAHASADSWIKDNLFLSTGFSYANLDDSFTGSTIYGDDFDVAYSPTYPAAGIGYNGLNGGAHKNEYVANVNLMSMPTKTLSIIPSVRIQAEDWNASSSGVGTLYDPAAGTGDTQPFNSNSGYDSIDVTERLDVRYTAVTNWVFSTGGLWTEGQGSLHENGGLTQVNGFGPVPVQFATDDSRLFQKYFANARWYPLRLASLDFGVYYKDNAYNYNNTTDNTPDNGSTGNAYPGFIVYQGFQTWDGSVRLTLHPLNRVTTVSRYEYQYSTIQTQPDSSSGLGEADSSTMLSHIIGQNVSWTPLDWLALQTGFNYVLSTTKTPASAYTQSVLNSQNNYWTANFNSNFVLDDKTDLNLGCFYYRADNGQNNIVDGVPLGSDQRQYSLTATLSRRLSKNMRWSLKYAYTHYDDFAANGNYNYDSNLIFTSLQYRF
jgi:hypothetical protein